MLRCASMAAVRTSRPWPLAILLLLPLLLVPPAVAGPCVLPDDGSGTVDLVPACPDGYEGAMVILDGLPPGSSLEIAARLGSFGSRSETPGGALGGDIQRFDATLELTMTGTGDLAGYQRFLLLPILDGETHTGPRTPGDPVQSMLADVRSITGTIVGDPDFDLLEFTTGTNHGLPGPGETTLTQLPGGDFNVDSFFDITYRIDFSGAPGGMLDGLAGSTQASTRIRAGLPAGPGVPCLEPDDGGGTIALPPLCPPGYVGHLEILDGLPPGTTIDIAAVLGEFLNRTAAPGGSLGGEVETWDGILHLPMTGTGSLAGYQRDIHVPVQGETESGPRIPGAPIQDFAATLAILEGEILGDPDFDVLRVAAGVAFGLPSPGHTRLELENPDWWVESFFDVSYRIEFAGAPGSPLDGLAGTTLGQHRFDLGVSGAVSAMSAPGEARLRLDAGRPNPFAASAATRLGLDVPGRCGPVSLRVFDVRGRLVRTLLRGAPAAGPQSVAWDGRDDRGEAVASGTYFVRLETAAGAVTRKVTRLR